MTSIEITKQRMVNQQIAGTDFKKPVQIVEWLGAVQAQEYALSKWSIGLRLPACKEVDVEKALNDGSLLRTHILRPTWHMVASADIRWMLDLSAPRVKKINAFMYRKLELDDQVFSKTEKVIAKALEGNNQLTRTQLQAVLLQKKIKAEGMRLGYIMMEAELKGLVCSGARLGNQATYALLDERVPAVKKKEHDEALAELTQRYFGSRGPASIKDFSVWSGLSVGQAMQGIGMVSKHFLSEKIEGEEYYFPPNVPAGHHQSGKAWLLPPYDEYIMGYKNKGHLFYQRNKMKPAPKTRFDNMILINGQVAGSWRRSVQNDHINLQYHLFVPAKTQLKAVEQAIKIFSVFTSLPVNIIAENKSSEL